MPVEIEIKLKVDHLAPVRDRLKQIGARRVGEAMETNIFFDTPDRALLSSDCGLRIRCSRDLTAHGCEKLVLTYKGPRGEGDVKRREEIEVNVDSIDAAAAVLERLGYQRMLSFEKRRESWSLEECKVELDQLPHLGSFVEIECTDAEDIQRIRGKLGLFQVKPIEQTYADLVAHHLSDRAHAENSLTFAD
jgi:adenylate cyclase class 2